MLCRKILFKAAFDKFTASLTSNGLQRRNLCQQGIQFAHLLTLVGNTSTRQGCLWRATVANEVPWALCWEMSNKKTSEGAIVTHCQSRSRPLKILITTPSARRESWAFLPFQSTKRWDSFAVYIYNAGGSFCLGTLYISCFRCLIMRKRQRGAHSINARIKTSRDYALA